MKTESMQLTVTVETPRDVIRIRAADSHIGLMELAHKTGIKERTFSSRLADGRWDTFQLNQLMKYITLTPEDIMFLIEKAAS